MVRPQKHLTKDASLGVVLLLLGGVSIAALLASAADPPNVPSPSAAAGPTDNEIVADLRAQIKGRGKEPAEAVYTNIKILQGIPAGAVLSIMEIAYNKSLGVRCDYCHDPKDWASDIKKQKGITRQMSGMLHDINEKYIKSIKGLK